MNIDNPQKITLCYWESASPINIPGISGTVDNFNETSFPIDELKRVEIKEVSELQTAPDEVFWAIRRTCYEITQENIKNWKSGNIAPDDRLFWLHMLRNYEIVEGVLIDNSIEALRRTDYNNWSLCVLVTDDYIVEVGGFIFFTESELLELERTNRHLWRDIREALRHDDFDYDSYDASLMAGADPIYRWYYDKVHKIIAMCNGDEKPIGIELSEIINEALIRSRITEEPSADDETAEAGAGGDPADQTLSDIQERAQALILQAVKPCLQYLGDKKKREDYWQGRKDLNGANLGQICLEQGRIIEGDNTYFTIKEGRCGYCSRGVWVQYGGAGKQYYILRRDAIEDELRKILKKVCNSLPLKNKK